MTPRVAILDYGCGNLASVANAVRNVGGDPFVSHHGSDIWTSDAVILPGQGHFAQAAPIAHQWLDGVAPGAIKTLGICLGMQLMCEGSEEAPGVKGLGWFNATAIPGAPKAECQRLCSDRLPHIGWNEVEGLGDFYFCHSYALSWQTMCAGAARRTIYDGCEFISMLRDDNLWAVQFHPEKSGKAGLALLAEFLHR